MNIVRASAFEVFTLDQKLELKPEIDRLSEASWPRFLLHGTVRHWDRLFDDFAEFQILFSDTASRLVAVGHTIPLYWDGTVADLPDTIDGVFERAIRDRQQRNPCNTLCAQAAMIPRSHRGQGLSTTILRHMKALAARHGFTSLIGPVRPTLKSRYPLTPFPRYVEWKRPDGEPFDPWIRTHWKLGARPLAVAPRSLTVIGCVADWEQWTGLAFPESGDYVVDGALQPVRIDQEHDQGCYDDPNYWMRHPVAPSDAG